MAEAISSDALAELNRAPRPLAEHLDQSIAIAAIKKYERRSNPSGLLRSAWNHAEYGLNTARQESLSGTEHFQTAQMLTGMVLNHPKATQDMMLNALTLSTYVPLFKKRAEEQGVERDDCESIYSSLGYAMRFLRPLQIDEPPQWRMTEIAVLALSARTRQPSLLMYPTSPREEMSTVASLNHDSYFLDNQDKIPVQQKLQPTQKVYDEWIQILAVQPLIDKALKHTGDSREVPLSDKVNYLLSLIVSETSGHKLSRDEFKFLNLMTESIAAHYFKAISSDRLQQAA